MSFTNRLRYIDLSFFQRFRYLDISRFYLLKKRQIALSLFYAAMLFAFLSSLRVWFCWPFVNNYALFSTMLLVPSMLISNSMDHPIYDRKDAFWPTIFVGIMLLYMLLVQEITVIAFLMLFFRVFVFFALFRISPSFHSHFATLFSKILACMLGISLLMFILFHLGLNLPGRNAEFSETYRFTNYYFFLIRDWGQVMLIPRFQAYFLEPGHMGTAIVLLLATQVGQMKKWYNIILLIALLFSFSLAAYVLLVIVMLLHLWMKRKRIIAKILFVSVLIAIILGSASVYNGGDNMLNQLIFMRLQMNEEGDDIEGNNRVTSSFQTEYDSFLQSSDVFFGRKVNQDIMHGNAGFKVFVYTYGFVGFILCYLTYFIAMHKAFDRRAFWAMVVLSLANFMVRAYPFWMGFFISYYLLAFVHPSNLALGTRGKEDSYD